jgi:hypothetical protein
MVPLIYIVVFVAGVSTGSVVLSLIGAIGFVTTAMGDIYG